VVLSADVNRNNEGKGDSFRERERAIARRRRVTGMQTFDNLVFWLRLLPIIDTADADADGWPPARRPGRVKPIRVKPGPDQRRVQRWAVRGTLTLTCLILSRAAAAQDARVLTPVEMFDPEQGQGLRLGSAVVAMPALDADVTYNSNVYNVDTNRTSDTVFSVRPSLTLRTDLPRHEFSLDGAGEFRRYAETGSENSDQWELTGNGRLDLASRTEVDMQGGFRRGIEPRGTAGDVFLTDRPVAFDQAFAGARVVRTGGFIEMLAEARIAEFDYKDATRNGVPLNLSGRDVALRRARLRASAPTGRNTRVFLEIAGNQVRYERRTPPSRNSSGFALLAGVQRNVTDLISFEAAGGYLQQDFANPAIKTVKGFNYHVLANWTPTPKWRITASADREIDASPREDVPALLRSSFRLQASNAVSDRLLLSAEGGFVDEDYRANPREDRRYFVNARLHYRLTDRVGLVAQAGYRTQDGKDGGRDYDGFTVGVGVRMAL
jgi:hypothetical protein